MADTIKISDLPTAASVNNTDYIVLDQASATVKATVARFFLDQGSISSSTLASTEGAGYIGTSTGKSVQATLTSLESEINSLEDLSNIKSEIEAEYSATSGASKVGTSSGVTVEDRLAANETSISDTTSEISKNTQDIASLTSTVSDNTTNISSNTSSISTLTSTVSDNTSDITTLKSEVADLTNTDDFDALSTLVGKKAYQVAVYSDLASLVPSKAGDVAVVGRRTSGVIGGGGIFVAVAGSATEDSGLVVNSTDYYWQRTAFTEVTPEMYGAVGDGSTDDTTAIAAAIQSGYNVRFAARTYCISAPCGDTTSEQGTKLTGAGSGKTIIKCTTTSARICVCGWGSTVEGIKFVAGVAGVVAYLQIGDSTAAVTSNGCNITACIFGDGSSSVYGLANIRLYNVWYSSISGNYFRGIGGNSSTIVTCIDAYFSVNIAVSNNSAEFIGYFIRWRSDTAGNNLANHCEGWVITNNDVAAQTTFFYSSNGLAPQISNNIIDIVYGVAIRSDSDRTQLSDNWIVADTTNTSAYFLYITGDQCSLQGNYINPQTKVTVALQLTGTPEHLSIVGNTFQGSNTCISANSGCNYVVLADNIFISPSVRPFDLSNTTYLTSHGNLYRNPTSAPLYPTTGAYITKKSWNTTVVASFSSAASTQTFTVTAPTGLFSTVPLVQATLASGSTPMVIIYNYDSSSTTSLSFTVIHPAGTTFSGSYRFMVNAVDQTY